MSLWDNIRGFFYPTSPPIERQLTPQQVWGSGGIWRPLSGAGIAVTVENAMKAAQGACIRLLADDIAALPVDVYRKVNGRPQAIDPPQWVTQPGASRWYLWPSYISEMTVAMLSDGNAFARGYPNTLLPQLLQPLDPRVVQVPSAGRYRVNGVDEYTDNDIIHVPWITLPGELRGASVIEASEDATGLEIAARQWAGAFFKNGGTLGGIVSVPGGPETVDADMLRQQFESKHVGSENWWKPGVLTGGATYSSDTVSPREADLEPLWRQVLEAAARMYHIPPHMLASQQSGAASYASVEQKSLEYVQHALMPIVTRLERAHSALIPGDDTYIKLNTNALLRGDTNARAQYYNLMLQSKVMRREEVREKEDLPWMGDLGWLETPNNESPSGDAAADPRSITISDVELRDEAAAQLANNVTAAVTHGTAQREADMAQMHTDILSKMQAQEARIDSLTSELASSRAARMRPSETKVVRDEKGRITGTVENRDGATVRKVIERDASGNVIRISEVAA